MRTIGKNELVIGLDGEMSSAELNDGGRLIQAGIAVRGPRGLAVTSQLISWPQMAWDPQAAQVHQLTRATVDAAPPAAEVDALLEEWLTNHGGTPGRRNLITVGFNVGAFDHPFFRHALPRTMAMVSRRSIDLNAVTMTLDGWDPNPRNAGPRRWTGWKRSAKTAARAALADSGVPGREHDAGYDAALALAAWEWLREQIHNARAPIRPPTPR